MNPYLARCRPADAAGVDGGFGKEFCRGSLRYSNAGVLGFTHGPESL